MEERWSTLYSSLCKNFSTLYPCSHLCPICGGVKELTYGQPICEGLASDWGLTAEQRRFFDFREGCACRHCGSSMRRMQMGMTVLEVVNQGYGLNVQFFKDLPALAGESGLRVAEINNCGTLHGYLEQLPGLAYSEYGSQNPLVRSEDLMRLSYADESFDLVLTSDVLEHVPDYRQALAEVRRVLKKDGAFIFTVPYLLDRPTVSRAILEGKEIRHLRSPSYHGEYQRQMADYLVFPEFGYDVLEELADSYETTIYGGDAYGGPIAAVFVCRRR